MTAKVLMIQGTMSSAGKSLLVAGLCRIYARRELRVAPFKAQNMSNNAAVCLDGSEIGRAQYIQAQACNIAPTVDMNPVLLKPEADSRSQVIVMGKPLSTLPAREYYKRKEYLWEHVTASLDRLREEYDLVIIEGAGSAAEVNLKKGDIVNMAVAKYANAPVLLTGDIDRGGIFAQLLGTLWLLEPDELALVKGLLVNKFRGDITLFTDGVQIIEERGNVPVLGVIPYVHHDIPEEDAVAIEHQRGEKTNHDGIDIVVLRLPRISNFDDFDPLAKEAGVNIRYVDRADYFGNPDAVIIPGTKSTMNDLLWLKQQNLDTAVQSFAQQGGTVVGICGGYQMLGENIYDPEQVESSYEQLKGLNLLPIETTFNGQKMTHQAQAIVQNDTHWLSSINRETISGYEIHAGRTTGNQKTAWLEITQRSGQLTSVTDGAVNDDGKIWGCYIHGLFHNKVLRQAWLISLGWQNTNEDQEQPNDPFDVFAAHLEKSLDMQQLDAIIGLDKC
jgi:adenosylcobyric acid synthase